MTGQQAIDFLSSRKRLGNQKDPAAMAALMHKLGDVQDKLRYIHITGTNGKGSTAKMIAGILTAAGYKTGLNISPFVKEFGERITIDGKQIGARELGSWVKLVKAAADEIEAEGHYATEFECTTAAALLWFAAQACDFVVLEVGIGGAHDATNLIKDTRVACILPVTMDHADILGDTPAAIAKEKSGIIKPGCTVVSAPGQLPEVIAVIRAAAQQAGAPLRIPEPEDIRLLWSTLRENHIDYGGYEVSLKMPGAHQAANAAVAVEAVLALCEQGFPVSDEAILTGLSGAKLPARIEMLRWDPLLIVDGAHNPGGGAALATALKSAHVTPLVAIIGMMADKQADEYLSELKGCFDIVYTVPADDSARAMPADRLAEIAAAHFRKVEAKATFEQAAACAAQLGRGVCVCGSLYLAGRAENFFT